MKISEMREMTNEELVRELRETQRAIFNLRFQRETERLEKPAELRTAKKTVACIQTILRERDLDLAPAADTTGKGKGE